MTSIDVSGLDRAAVIAALFNHTRPFRAGELAEHAGEPMSVAEARRIINSAKPRSIRVPPREGEMYIEFGGALYLARYIRGHYMDLVFQDADKVDVTAYDEVNGGGLADRVISRLKETGETAPQ